jgi:hypothetical protein
MNGSVFPSLASRVPVSVAGAGFGGTSILGTLAPGRDPVRPGTFGS